MEEDVEDIEVPDPCASSLCGVHRKGQDAQFYTKHDDEANFESKFGIDNVSVKALGPCPVVTDCPQGKEWLFNLVEKDIRENHWENIKDHGK